MPAYHSSMNEMEVRQVCGCGIYPIKTKIKGPAPVAPEGMMDIVDETINFFRANVLMTNFEVKGPADRLLVYLTLYVHKTLTKCERAANKADAQKTLHQLAIEQFALPGDNAFPLGGMIHAPRDAKEKGVFA